MAETMKIQGVVGVKTLKLAGGNIADDSFWEMLIATGLTEADLEYVDHFNICPVTATDLFYTNDGAAATADGYPLGIGSEMVERNSRYFMKNQLRFFTANAYDLRVTLWS